ncbi:hypothetical protein BDW02DRAFT_465783, partial [Decorospora gaudefroyi]
MPITFGSVGDIIAVCVLVKECADALSETNGSTAQYRGVVRELTVLEKALLEVAVLSRTHATTPELISIFANAKTTVARFRAEVVAYSVSIDQILAAATMHTVKAQGDRLDARIQSLQQDYTLAFDRQDDLLKEIRSRLDEVDSRISASSSLIIKAVKKARKTWFLQLGQELKA